MRHVRNAVVPAMIGMIGMIAALPSARAEDGRPDGSDLNPETRVFLAGASAIDISPPRLPVRQNGGFLEANAHRVIAPLFARALALSDGKERVAVVVVDSCMLPRTVCDTAKALATRKTGIPRERILISSTHTHSAPSAMNYCLGSRADPHYTEWLPPRIAEAIITASERQKPAEIGVTVAHAPEHTNCRRWILRRDRVGVDPFGDRTVRAMMHPGYQNPNYVGPAGPIDPDLSLLAVRGLDGRPIALLGNYSMHYFGVGGGLSPDFCGLFAQKIAARVAPDDKAFVGMLSQGTSGDLHWMDYSQPRRAIDIDTYTQGLVNIAAEAHRTIRYRRWVPLVMEESRVTLARRRPDAPRLEWAKRTLPDPSRRPRNRQEVYAEQAFYIDQNPQAEVVLQALRIGELGITAIPCEVYGLTGLELKARSPLQPTFNMELANGAAGYIPPPAQHALGGYTTWPARTAGLEVGAEPKIIDIVLGLLEKVAAEKRREPWISDGTYPRTILASRPVAYWRLEEFRGPQVADRSGNGRHAAIQSEVAFHLSGPKSTAFSMDDTNRCVHLAGGKIEATALPLRASYSLEMWFWNGLTTGGPDGVLGTLLRCGSDVLRIVSVSPTSTAHLAIGEMRGKTTVVAKTWHHVAFVRAGSKVSVYLDGRLEIEGTQAQPKKLPRAVLTVGRGEALEKCFEGKIDEISVFDRALSPSDVVRHHASAGIPRPEPAPEPSGIDSKPSRPADLERTRAAIRKAKPVAYWPLIGTRGNIDASGNGHDGELERGAQTRKPAANVANFTGGRMHAALKPLGDRYTVELWFLNELANTARPVTGYIFSRGVDGAAGAPGEHLGIGGTHAASGRLIVFNGNRRNQLLTGKTHIPPRSWNHVALVRDGDQVRVYLNGRPEPDAAGQLERTYPREGPTDIFIGGRNDNFANFRGRIDQVAVHDRPLTPAEVGEHFRASGVTVGTRSKNSGTTAQARPKSQPRTPQETLAATRVRQGFRLELVAAEPLVRDPVAVDWDQTGRLWVVEMADYPYGMEDTGGQPKGRATKAGGRVRYLEDTDRDGRYDRSTLFAQGLSFPTGVLAWRKGILVTAAPDILYLEDRDNDGRADHREVLFTGFLPGNQQLRINGLRWGLDNWIYCANGGHHAGHGAGRRVRSARTGKVIALGSRDFRVRPAEGRLDPQSGPAQFGRVRDDWGNWFGVQNSRPLWHYVLADHYARRNEHVAAPDARLLLYEVNPPLWPAKMPQKRYHSFEHATRFTSACGIAIYRDDLLFQRDGTTHAFTCDPFHSLVQHHELARQGVSFTARVDTQKGQHDFFASADRWCRPVMARTGPDGALWIVDMYRYMIEHPDWLPPAGREELRPFYRSGDDHGRIYRVVPMERKPRGMPDLAAADSITLVDQLRHSNGPTRDLAQRLLVERKDARVIPRLERMARGDTEPRARLHALCALDGMGFLQPSIVRALLEDADSRVVRHALRLAEPHGNSEGVIAAAVKHVGNPDPATRLQLAHTLGEWRDPRAGKALGRLAVRDHRSPWIRAAVLSSAVAHQDAIADEIATDAGGSLREFTSPLLTLALRTNRVPVVTKLLRPLVRSDATTVEAWQLEALGRFLDAIAAASSSLDRLAKGLGALVEPTRRLIDIAPTFAVTPARTDGLRAAAARFLGRSGANRERDHGLLRQLLTPTVPSEIQLAAVSRFSSLQAEPSLLLAAWKSYVPSVRGAVARVLLSRPAWTGAFLDAIESGDVPSTSIAALERQQLVRHKEPALASKARRLLAVDSASDRQGALAALRPAIRLSGIPDHGREVFAKRCASCHAIDGVGKAVGPDLRALNDRSGQALLAAIVDPNAAVEPRYIGYTAVLRTGDVVHGLIIGETANSIIFQLPDGSNHTVLRGAIHSLQSSEKSFMPEGLEADLSLRDLADLMAFLQEA